MPRATMDGELSRCRKSGSRSQSEGVVPARTDVVSGQRQLSILGMDWEEKTRKKIQTSQITNRLISFIEGEIVLEPAQVSASLGLLKKVLPDLTNTTHAGGTENVYTITWEK
jgi:hypothetical protein